MCGVPVAQLVIGSTYTCGIAMPMIPSHFLEAPRQQPAVCAVFGKHIRACVSDISSGCICTPQKYTFLQKSPPLGLGVEGHVPQQLEIALRMLEAIPGLIGNSRKRRKLPFPALKKIHTQDKQAVSHAELPESTILVCSHICGTWKTVKLSSEGLPKPRWRG